MRITDGASIDGCRDAGGSGGRRPLTLFAIAAGADTPRTGEGGGMGTNGVMARPEFAGTDEGIALVLAVNSDCAPVLATAGRTAG